MVLLKKIIHLLDAIVPRFLDEDVVLFEDEQGYHLCKPLRLVEEGEVFDGIVTVRVFNLFGIALSPKVVSDVRPFRKE